MHAGIFWGFVLLTIGTANIVTGGLDPGGPVDPVRRRCSGPRSARCRTSSRVSSSVAIALGVLRGGCRRGRARLTLNRDALADPGDDRRRSSRPSSSPRSSRSPRYGDDRRARSSRTPLGGAALGRSTPALLEARSRSLWWAHIALVAAFLVLPAVQQAPPHRDERSRTSASASSRRAASCRRWTSRREDATFGLQDAPGPRLEGPPRRLHLHRVRPLPGRPARPGTPASRSTPRRSSWASATCRSRPSTGSTSSRTRRSCARRTASTTRLQAERRRAPDRRHGDPVRRGLGLRDLRRVRRGLPGADRARRQDRRAAPQPRPRGLALPAGADGGVPGDGGPGQPVGPAGVRPGSTGRRACRSTVPTVAEVAAAGRLDELEVLYWVGCAAAFDDAQPEGRPGRRDLPRRGRRVVRGPRPGGVVHRRPGPPDGQRLRLPDPRRATSRRSTATGWASGRS